MGDVGWAGVGAVRACCGLRVQSTCHKLVLLQWDIICAGAGVLLFHEETYAHIPASSRRFIYVSVYVCMHVCM